MITVQNVNFVLQHTVQLHADTHLHTHICTHTHTHKHARAHTHTHTHTHKQACTHINMSYLMMTAVAWSLHPFELTQ